MKRVAFLILLTFGTTSSASSNFTNTEIGIGLVSLSGRDMTLFPLNLWSGPEYFPEWTTSLSIRAPRQEFTVRYGIEFSQSYESYPAKTNRMTPALYMEEHANEVLLKCGLETPRFKTRASPFASLEAMANYAFSEIRLMDRYGFVDQTIERYKIGIGLLPCIGLNVRFTYKISLSLETRYRFICLFQYDWIDLLNGRAETSSKYNFHLENYWDKVGIISVNIQLN